MSDHIKVNTKSSVPAPLVEFFNRLREEAEEFVNSLEKLRREAIEGWGNGLPEYYLPILVDQLKVLERDIGQISTVMDEVRAQLGEQSQPDSLSIEQKQLVNDQHHMNRVIELIKPLMLAASMWVGMQNPEENEDTEEKEETEGKEETEE